jgi:antitoxin component YwqK of YwqJK toxin-antitoxin module
MNSLNIFFTSILSLYFLTGCNNNSQGVSFERKNTTGKTFIVKRTYDKKRDILIEELLDADSMRNGYYKEYFVGQLKDSGNYKNGQKEGLWYHWDLAGDLIKIEHWFSGRQFGEEVEYYNKTTSGDNKLYKYSFYNIEGHKIFESKFDLNGNLLTSEGAPLYCAYNTAKIYAGNIYELICFLGIPKKGFNWKFYVEEIERKTQKKLFKKDFTNHDLEELPFAKRFYQTKKYLSKGTYDWKLFLQIHSLTGDTLFSGYSTLSIIVR